MTDAESVERILAEASSLTLLEAACLLWRRKRELDALERSSASMQPYIDMGNREMNRAVAYWEVRQLGRAREIGDDPPTIARLKRIHPAASDDALRQAVKASIAIEEERQRLADIARIMTEAEQRPLIDAAYHLYMKKSELDRLETVKPAAPMARTDWQVIRQTVRQVFQQLAKERAEGYEEATFQRLKRAHPEASDSELAQALKAGIKLDVDCLRYYSDKSPKHGENLDRAIELARKDNPGFQETTYHAAHWHLAWAMR